MFTQLPLLPAAGLMAAVSRQLSCGTAAGTGLDDVLLLSLLLSPAAMIDICSSRCASS